MQSIAIPSEVWAAVVGVLTAIATVILSIAQARKAEKPSTIDDVMGELKALRETADEHTQKLEILLDRTPR